jgi:hypothetical protein
MLQEKSATHPSTLNGYPNTLTAWVEAQVEKGIDRTPVNRSRMFSIHAITWPDGRTQPIGFESLWPFIRPL